MKLFGMYLIDINLVDEAAVCEALVIQAKETPSLTELVHEHNLLSLKDQLRVMARQHETGVDYRRSCVELGVWTVHIEESLRQLISKRRRPLGEILVTNRMLTIDQLDTALADFLALGNHGRSPFSVGHTLAGNYVRLFDESTKRKLSEIFGKERDDDHELSTILKSLLVGASILAAKASARIWQNLIDNLTLDNEQWKQTSASSIEAIGAAWKMREMIERTGCERES